MSSPLRPSEEIIYAVGVIVLCSQEIERHLKFLVPYMDAHNPKLNAVLSRHKALARKSLGEVAGQFVAAATGDVEVFRADIKQLVNERNEIVHHFSDKYGKLMAQDRHQEVMHALRDHHRRAVAILGILTDMSLSLVELMRDTTFAGTPEQESFARLCDSYRASLAR